MSRKVSWGIQHCWCGLEWSMESGLRSTFKQLGRVNCSWGQARRPRRLSCPGSVAVFRVWHTLRREGMRAAASCHTGHAGCPSTPSAWHGCSADRSLLQPAVRWQACPQQLSCSRQSLPHRLCILPPLLAKPSKQAGQNSKPPPSKQQQQDEEEEEEFEDEDGEFEDEGEYGEEDASSGELDDAVLLDLEADEAAPGVDTTGASWAEVALRATNKVLATPAMDKLELYVFRALPGPKLDIRLDRLDDPYGSPSIDDIEKFCRMLFVELDAELGEEAGGDISLEVSSPGAERTLRLPQDLNRFAELPLTVEFMDAETAKIVIKVMALTEFDEAAQITRWRLADVRANAPAKGRRLSKRQQNTVVDIPLASIKQARVHVDF